MPRPTAVFAGRGLEPPALGQNISASISFIYWGPGADSSVGRARGFQQWEGQHVVTRFLIWDPSLVCWSPSAPHSPRWPLLWPALARLYDPACLSEFCSQNPCRSLLGPWGYMLLSFPFFFKESIHLFIYLFLGYSIYESLKLFIFHPVSARMSTVINAWQSSG